MSLLRVIALAALATAPFGIADAFCGFYAGKADASLFNEASQVVVARDGNRTVISMMNDYKGPLTEFALIVPTPVVLTHDQVRILDPAVVQHLDAYSSPRLAEYSDDDPCRTEFPWGVTEFYVRGIAMAAAMPAEPAPMLRDKALGVTVEAKYTVGEYDIVSLSAEQSDGLQTWLRENGYSIPRGTAAALKPYINQGMKFFVAKVNIQQQMRSGYNMLRPLQFAFDSDKFMLPMRLGMLNASPDKPQDLIIYLLTRHGRVESANYRTAKLPANVNLPPFVKPQFADFYKAMFDSTSARENYRVVFTEYFWNMGWCDPCAAEPLDADELRQAGVFWLDPPAGGLAPARALPVLLTRLHVRYTPRSYPEDLMFLQTEDTLNWQARYVIQKPYGGSVAECSERTAKLNCTALCRDRVGAVRAMSPSLPRDFRGKSPGVLSAECLSSCESAKAEGLDAALRYYREDLPQRLAAEKNMLEELTGWSRHAIDAMQAAGGS